MPRVTFTPHLQRFLDAPPVEVAGGTVRDVLESVFAANPRLRGYLVDERGQIRKHVTIFVGDRPITDRHTLSDTVDADTEIYVMQALSGGAPE
jgi:sulfur-carrier protein